jgi:serine/threonine protein kinase
MPKLVCQSGHNAGHEYPLTKDVTILGRQSSCDVQVQDEMSSRAHCQLRRDGRLFSLVDLGSRNGTLLNNKKVSERLLSYGDVIRIGKAEYLLVKEPGDLELRDLLSKYEILEKIGEGGMGIVYKANQRSMARIVALKILSPKYSSKRKFVEQFTREARAAGSLNHPNIIQVHDVGTENDIHYFSMEFVDGPTCMQVLKSQGGPFPVADAMEIIRQTARALEYAHAHRLIHQDIKPDNIMVGPNNIVKLADLGISKTFDEAEDDAGQKKVMGTPHYMAPEAALGKKVDQRVDIYSLGATAYHLLSGKTPFQGSSPTEVLKHHVMDPLPPIAEINPEVPPKVVALIDKMMSKKPEDRQQNAAEVIEDIRLSVGTESANERAGGETMILRRYAKGGPTAASVPTPASLTTGSRTPGGDMTTPGEGSGKVSDDRRLRLLNRSLAAGIAIAAVACAIVLIRSCGSPGTKTPDGGVAASDPAGSPAATTSASAPAPAVATPDALAQQHHDHDAKALSDLEERLSQDQVDPNELLAELNKITDGSVDNENLARVRALTAKIKELQERRRSDQVVQNFDRLSADARKLADDHDYDSALNRLDAFPDRHDDAVKAGFDKLRLGIDGEKAAFRADILAKIESAKAGRDLQNLKQLRDSLPAPFLNSDIEQDIVKAMKQVNDARQKDEQPLLDKATKEMADWDFSGFDEQWINDRPNTDGNVATQFDHYHDVEQRLLVMIKSLSQRLKQEHAMRYPGTLRGMEDPDLEDATSDQGLELSMSNGGTLRLRWTVLTTTEVSSIVEVVLGKDVMNSYKPALAAMDAIKQSLPTHK